MDQYIGKLLDNRYEILQPIGTGGMARVYKARCHRLNRLVAIKILREDLAQDAEFRRRFHDESQAVAMLSHPNIVAVYDVSRASELEYIVMELIDGITLKQYMQKKRDKLNWREALHFITQIVKALGHAHSRGIIHRDIKPHNIMVLRDGSVKVADFGIARVVSGQHSTLTQEALGSVHYISPEQARGSHIDARSDLYSAGVVLYEMITGRLPFEGDTPVSVAIQHINSIPLSPKEIDPELPEAMEKITMRAMAPKVEQRYSSADEMLLDLDEFRKNPNIKFDYNPADFLQENQADAEHTRVRVAVSSRQSTPEAKRGAHRRYQHEESAPERGSPWPILVSVGAILLFLVGVFYFLNKVFFSSLFPPTQSYVVPPLVGLIYDEVVQDTQLLEDHFTVSIDVTMADDAPAGTILKQDPAAQTSAAQDKTEILVTVSSGPDVIEMPDVRMREYRQAYLDLVALGLTVDTPTHEYHDTVPKDYVISFTPPEGALLARGTQVSLVVSKGREIKNIPMPSLVSMTKEKAESTITTMNLGHGAITEVYDETIEAGRVVSQYPQAATEVPEGTVVNLEISRGPDPNALPKEKTKTITITLPETGEVINVQVMMDNAVVYQENADTAMSSTVSFQVTAMGTQTLAVYFNGVLADTIVKDFS